MKNTFKTFASSLAAVALVAGSGLIGSGCASWQEWVVA